MTYINRRHVQDKETKLRLDAEKHERLKRVASKQAKQPAAFVRMYVEKLLEMEEKEGIEAVERLLDQRQRA